MKSAASDVDGKIRIRFESLSQRLNKVNVDIYHKDIGTSFHLQETLTSPDTGALGCFLLDEFELLKTSESSPAFFKLYGSVTPLAKSLPELIHHQKQVVDHFVEFFKHAPAKDMACGFTLVSVLGRDLGKELFPHFHALFAVLVKAVPKVAMSGGATAQQIAPNPELTGKLFEACSYLLRANLAELVEAPQELSPYYGTLLGNTVHFVRDFAAKSFTIVTRKLSGKVFKDHFRKLIKAVGNNLLQVLDNDKLLFLLDVATSAETIEADKVGGDIRDSHSLLEGLALLLFYTCRGITGQMHSKASIRFESLSKIYQLIIASGDGDKPAEAFGQLVCFATVFYQMIQSLQEYVFAQQQKDISLCLMSVCQDSVLPAQRSAFTDVVVTVKLRLLLLLLENRKAKGIKCLEPSSTEAFIKMCLDSFQRYSELSSHATLANTFQSLFVKLWLYFPHHPRVLANAKSIAAKICAQEKGLLYLSSELLPKLNKSISQEFLVPALSHSLLAFKDSLPTAHWLVLVLNLLVRVEDDRGDLQSLHEQAINGDTVVAKQDLSVAICIEVRKFIEPIKKALLDALKDISKANIELALAARLMTWFYRLLPGDSFASLKKAESKVFSVLKTHLMGKSDSVGRIANPELLVLAAHMVTRSSDDTKSNVDLLSSLVNRIVDTWIDGGQDSVVQISAVAALDELVVALSGKLEDAPNFFLSSFLSAEKQSKLLYCLSFALTTPSYWLRWNIVKLLRHFEPPLDKSKKKEKDEEDEGVVHYADVGTIFLECLSIPVDLHSEREITRRLEVLEVFCRGDERLPYEYKSLITGFCVGLLNVKFKPLWSTIITVLVSVAHTKQGEEIIWRMLAQYFDYRTFFSAQSQPHAISDHASSAESLVGLCSQLLGAIDSGKIETTKQIMQSAFFPLAITSSFLSTLAVMPDARAEEESLFASFFLLLQKAPTLTLNKSKLIVTAFLGLLKYYYYQVFRDEPEIAILNRFGAFIIEGDDNTEVMATATIKQVRARLESFLKAFGAVNSPKQLHKHQVLYIIYNEFLSKPDSGLSSLALDCILTYKQPEIVQYKEMLKKLYDDRAFRNELIRLCTKPEDAMVEDGEVVVKDEDKPTLFPTVIRILFGRLTSRSGGKKADREQTTARRAAVLAFLSTVDTSLLAVYIHLMVRGVTPTPPIQDMEDDSLVSFNSNQSDHKLVLKEITKCVQQSIKDSRSIDHATLSSVYWEKMVGFLYLLKPTISILSLGLVGYQDLLYHILSEMLLYAHQYKSSSIQLEAAAVEEEMDEVDQVEEEKVPNKHSDEKASTDTKHASNVRTLCLQSLGDFLQNFHSVFSFEESSSLLRVIQPLIEALPSALLTASKPPALLVLLEQISRYANSNRLLLKSKEIVSAIIYCISKSEVEVNCTKMVIEILDRLLEIDMGKQLRPYTEELVVMFTHRFIGIDVDENRELKLSEMEISNLQSIRYELQFLCKLGTFLFIDPSIKIKSTVAHNFATLVLGMIRSYTTKSKRMRMSEDWMVGVLNIYQSMVPRLSDVSGHVTFLARLFGPCINNQSKVFDASIVRKKLTEVYLVLSGHHSVSKVLQPLGAVIASMTKLDSEIIDCRDFSSLMPIFQQLGDEKSLWNLWTGPKSHASDKQRSVSHHVFLTSAVLFETLRCMFDAEMFVRRSALVALKQLVQEVALWGESDQAWHSIIGNILMPAVRNALKESNDAVKCGFIHLLAHMVKCYHGIPVMAENEFYHTDMHVLLHQDPEQDFFENISHIQVHRRARAFLKLGAILKEAKEPVLRVSTLVHVLMPIVFHYLQSDEFSKKLHQKLLEEVTAFFGPLALHLPWNHFYALVKRLLKMMHRTGDEKEKFVQNSLCAVLDAFHFDMTVSNISTPVTVKVGEVAVTKIAVKHVQAEEEEEDGDDEKEDDVEEQVVQELVEAPKKNAKDEAKPTSSLKNNIALTVINQIIPWLKGELVKVVKDQHGDKTEKIQTNMALAVTNLIKHLEPPIVTTEFRLGLFSNVIISVVNTLKSRDVKVRDVARSALSKMIGIIGLNALAPVLYEMRSALREGYQRHVNAYTVRSLLTTALDNYTPPTDAPLLTLEQLENGEVRGFTPTVPPFDTALPFIMKTVLDDIGEEMREEREIDGVIRSTMREQKGSKYTDILEIVGRCLLFRPTYALLHSSNPSSLSSVHCVVTPLLASLSHAENSLVYNRVSEGLQRLATGLVKNPSVSGSELLIYLHSTLQPYVGIMVQEHRRFKIKVKGTLVGVVKASNKTGKLEDEESDMEAGLPSYLLESTLLEDGDTPLDFINDAHDSSHPQSKSTATKGLAVQPPPQWHPQEWNSLKTQRNVIIQRNQEARERVRVQDGANAPQLTGRNRYDRGAAGSKTAGKGGGGTQGVSRSTLMAIRFCLTVLHTAVKKGVLKGTGTGVGSGWGDMLTPFVPLLRAFLCVSGGGEVVTLSLKCLSAIVLVGSVGGGNGVEGLGGRVLRLILRQGGGGVGVGGNDICQAGLVCLTSLFKRHNEKSAGGDAFPLSVDLLRPLLDLLSLTITSPSPDTIAQLQSLQLFKEIIAARALLPEVYEIIDKLMALTCHTHRVGVRDVSGAIIIKFLLSYPMAEKKREGYVLTLLKIVTGGGGGAGEVVYAEGRLAALSILTSYIQATPAASWLSLLPPIFLTLSERLVNETHQPAREVGLALLAHVLKQETGGEESVCLAYSLTWLRSLTPSMHQPRPPAEALGLVRGGAQGLVVMCRVVPARVRKAGGGGVKGIVGEVYRILMYLLSCMDGEAGAEEGDIYAIWSALYHVLLLLDALFNVNKDAVESAILSLSAKEYLPEYLQSSVIQGTAVYERYAKAKVWELLTGEVLRFPHPWVKAAALRILAKCLASIRFCSEANVLYSVCKGVCMVSNVHQVAVGVGGEVQEVVRGLVRVLLSHPHLDYYAAAEGGDSDEDAVEDEEQDDEEDEDVQDNDDEDEMDEGAEEKDEEVKEEEEGEGGNNVMLLLDKLGILAPADAEMDVQKGKKKAALPTAATAGTGGKRVLSWLLSRLKGVGKDRRGDRRVRVMRIFRLILEDSLAGNSTSSSKLLRDFAPLLLDLPLRHLSSPGAGGGVGVGAGAGVEEAQSLLGVIEAGMGGGGDFMATCTQVREKILGKKREAKVQIKLQAVRDPQAFAKRKMQRAEEKRRAQKRKGGQFALMRGAKRSRGGQ